MGMIVYGRKVRETRTEVAYTFGFDAAEPAGVLVIPLDDVYAWYIEGAERGEKSIDAKHIAGKAYLVHTKTGSWPDDASFYA